MTVQMHNQLEFSERSSLIKKKQVQSTVYSMHDSNAIYIKKFIKTSQLSVLSHP